MLVTSRSAAEYAAMFNLTPGDVAGRSVLDCCAGGSSFAAETDTRVVAVDPAYALDRQVLAERVRASLDDTDRIIAANADRFEWGWYGEPAQRAQQRTAAARRFLADLRDHPERYVAGALPNLPLASRSFDIVLCSHLLFTWADHLDANWHRAALTELVRVARQEVRLFPLVVQGAGHPVPFLDDLRAELAAAGCRSEVRAVPYRFQRGADRMLVIDLA
jgi:hypothetical protein